MDEEGEEDDSTVSVVAVATGANFSLGEKGFSNGSADPGCRKASRSRSTNTTMLLLLLLLLLLPWEALTDESAHQIR